MWNETKPMPLAERAGVTLESPFVGAADLLKPHQARASKKFALREQPFLDLVNVRGEASGVRRRVRAGGRLPPPRAEYRCARRR
jgi:sarcosine oxidase subunit gamma